MKTTQWHGCYDQQWAGIITPQSFAHPAKFSRGLIERIYRHCLERGYLKRGDLVGDCFGGIGTGGIMAAYAGLRWVGVELEPRFVEMAKANFAKHATYLRMMWDRFQPEIIQGDSRQFDKIVMEVCGIVSSPPFVDTLADHSKVAFKEITGNCHRKAGHCSPSETGDAYGTSPGQIGSLPAGDVAAVVSSPPFQNQMASHDNFTAPHDSQNRMATDYDSAYGQAPGQIGRLKGGELAAVCTSPPYAESIGNENHIDYSKSKDPNTSKVSSPARASIGGSYGQTEGQIGKLPAGEVAAVVSSPPYEEGLGHGGGERNIAHDTRGTGQAMSDGYPSSPGQIGRLNGGELAAVCTSPPYISGGHHPDQTGSWGGLATKKGLGTKEVAGYGKTEGQIGQKEPDDYWHAVRDVYAACFRVIKPGGVIVLVVKSYVKNRRIVDLPTDTLTLLKSLGFEPLERIHAMLKETTVHNDLFEGTVTKVKSRASFFRRLAEKKGAPPIDWEEVLICRKPNDSPPPVPIVEGQ